MSAPSCPLCGSGSELAFTARDLNRQVSDAAFRYRRCLSCGVTFLENVPEDLTRYYGGGYHRAPSAGDLETWAAYEGYKIDLVKRFLDAGRILDIGSSYGAFPYLSQRAGFEVAAVEADRDACAFMRASLGIEAIHSLAPAEVLRERDGSFDAITLWHSLEHLSQPWRTIQAAAQRLSPGGHLFVATPNPAGVQARLLGARWTHVDAPRHLFLVPRATLCQQAASSGLTPVYSTAADVETRRLNRTGWQAGLRELGLRMPGVWLLGAGLATLAGPVEERGIDRGSAYVSVFRRPAR